MPLFRRSDGMVVNDVSPVRRIMPYLMPGRNQSAVYHSVSLDVTRTRRWLRSYNRANGSGQATLFHLFLYACARMLQTRPQGNRFVSGGRLYQRKGVWISFAVKTAQNDDAPLATVKLPFPPNQTFRECVADALAAVEQARSGRKTQVDSELDFLLKLPGPLLRLVFLAGKWLDAWNLMPASMIDPDPMYTSLFIGNLRSIALGKVFHHLYEYGTCSLFAVFGGARKAAVNGLDSQASDIVDVGWTIDERVCDGFYCVESLARIQGIMENPEEYLGAFGDVIPDFQSTSEYANV